MEQGLTVVSKLKSDIEPNEPDKHVNPIGHIIGYRTVYVLSTINAKTGLLKGSHYAAVVCYGPAPLWGVWTIKGKFLAWYGSRKQIENTYSNLTWRRRATQWEMVDMEDHGLERRREELQKFYHTPVPESIKK